jgi:hypothetical protein
MVSFDFAAQDRLLTTNGRQITKFGYYPFALSLVEGS